MTTVLSIITDIIQQIKNQPLTEYEKNEMKNALIDRIGCGLGAKRLNTTLKISKYFELYACKGYSTIWGSNTRTQSHIAALVNGASSSHLEYDSHDSMIPSTIALGEEYAVNGETILQSIKIGYVTCSILKTLLASSVEERGMHWPAYISAFISSAACSNVLDLSKEETANSISIAACLSPASPFEAFTKGASVKDLYGGWGNMLGVQSVQLGKLGLTGPDSIFEGERGLFKNWLVAPQYHEIMKIDNLLEDNEIKFRFKPFPCCTAAHPTLTALEGIIIENPWLSSDEIMSIDINTYRFGAELSEESNPETPIGAKVNIPFLAASLLIHKEMLPEHSEKPWIYDNKVRELARRIHVGSDSKGDELYARKRWAKVIVTMRNGERIESFVEASRWSKNGPTKAEIQDKFRSNVGAFFSKNRSERIITKIEQFEFLEDIRELTDLLCPE